MSRLRGFSLIELSIVLIIIGLLVASVFAGKSLLESSKYKSFMSEIDAVRTSIGTFHATYEYLPGDFPDASDYFISKLATCTNAVADPIAGTGCNGNGNHILDGTSGMGDMYMAWLHMQLAEMIGGSYSGYSFNPGSSIHTDKSNSFNSEVMAGILFVLFPPNGTNTSVPLYGNRGKNNIIRTGRFNYLNFNADTGYITPAEAHKIDNKYDDGKAKLGKIIAQNHLNDSLNYTGFGASTDHCTTLENDNGATDSQLEGATYKLANSLKACELIFMLR